MARTPRNSGRHVPVSRVRAAALHTKDKIFKQRMWRELESYHLLNGWHVPFERSMWAFASSWGLLRHLRRNWAGKNHLSLSDEWIDMFMTTDKHSTFDDPIGSVQYLMRQYTDNSRGYSIEQQGLLNDLMYTGNAKRMISQYGQANIDFADKMIELIGEDEDPAEIFITIDDWDLLYWKDEDGNAVV